MKRSPYRILILIAISTLVPKLAVCQNTSVINPAEGTGKNSFLKAIEADPDNLSLHKDYLDLFSAKDTVMNYYSRQPSDLFSDIMFKYALKIGKDSNQVYTDVNAIRYKGVKKATPFSLLNYETSKKVALEDFKGKVVLLTYWFPNCGPCRAEFPYFESVLKKFNRDQVAYIGINTTLEEDALVLPYIRNSGCTFIPLKDNPLWDRGTIDWSGAPTNYLIDQEGNVVFSNFRTHKGNERTLEMMIAELLRKKTK